MTGQQLKNSILQMAVQGKLVPQDPNDEPASVLLERIRAEKEQLTKEGKIKKEKNPSIIFRGGDNLPYEKIGKNEPVCIADEDVYKRQGLYGMENQEWMRRTVYDRDFDSEDMGMLQEAMAVIDREEALKLYDAGADIYLITSFSTPQFVTERMEIERGPEHYQLPMTRCV